MSNPESAVTPPKPLSIQLVGIGNAGINALQHIAQTELSILPACAVHAHERALAASTIERKILIGRQLLRGLGAGGDPALGKAAAEEDPTLWNDLFAGADLALLLCGLGGGVGSGAAPVLARAAKESGALALAIAMLPFDFEGARRQQQAAVGFHQLKCAADAVISLPNQKLAKLLHENTRVTEAFQWANDWLAQGVRGLWRLLTQPGLLRVDFAGLCAVTRGRQSESSLLYAEADGDNRSRDLVEKLLSSPLLDQGQVLAEADGLLVNLCGGRDLTMAEINRVMESLSRHCESAQLVVGAAIDPALERKLTLTLITAKRTARDERPSAYADANARSDPSPAPESEAGFDSQFFNPPASPRPPSRFVAPPPALTAAAAEQLLSRQKKFSQRASKAAGLWLQGQLPLEIVSKGRFEKIEPTIHRGEDLDVPTYIRRGVPLN